MADTFNALVPYIYDNERYSNPNNKKLIEPKLDDLLFFSSRLDKHIGEGLSGKDPLFDLGLKALKKSIEKGVDSYRVESFDYSQELLQSSINYCVKCHTRTYLGPSFSTWDNFSKPKGMKPVDLAKIYIATREFEKSVKTLEKYVTSPGVKAAEQVIALKLMVTVGLKNMNSPVDTLKSITLVSGKVKSKKVKSMLRKWSFDVKAWEKLVSRKVTSQLFKAVSSVKNKDLNYVSILSQTVVLHNGLSVVLQDKKRAEIYYSLGKIYSSNKSMSFLALPDLYFESCVRKYPHSDVARKCYYALEVEVRRGHKLDPGEPFPNSENLRFKKLKVLTEKLKNGPSSAFGGEGL